MRKKSQCRGLGGHVTYAPPAGHSGAVFQAGGCGRIASAVPLNCSIVHVVRSITFDYGLLLRLGVDKHCVILSDVYRQSSAEVGSGTRPVRFMGGY